MKKIVLLTLILLSMFTSQAFANESTTTIHTTIDKIYYDTDSHVYYANSVKDEQEGFWTVCLLEGDRMVIETLERLTREYKGKPLSVVYVGDIDNDDEIEILSQVFGE